MKIKFKNTEEVYQFLKKEEDAWCRPMIEEYVGMCSPEEHLDITELNQWIESEYSSLARGYEHFLDND